MKWDIDKTLTQLEDLLGGRAPGTGMNRVYVDPKYAYEHGIKPRKEDLGTLLLWCLSHGMAREPKNFFYGRTIRECCLNARRFLLKKRILTRKKPAEPDRRKKASPSS